MSGEHYIANTHRRDMTLCEKCEKILEEDGGGDNVTIEFCKPCREVMNKNIRKINEKEKKEIHYYHPDRWFDPRTAVMVCTITNTD